MRFYSPLRYPGGKSKLSKFVSTICIENNVNGCYVEPYAGGASVALFLLLEGYVNDIVINDKDRSIYAFWYSVLKKTIKFCNLIESADINLDTWRKCKDIQRNKGNSNLLELGFSTFFLNRTNISGIIDAGVIGGYSQSGKYKMNCRFNKKELIERINQIAKFKRHIEIHNLDALALIDLVQERTNKSNTIFYFDPPYFLKGPSLYMNHYKHSDHKDLAHRISQIRDIHWIVSYDDVSEIELLYRKYRNTQYSLSYSAVPRKMGSEILFFSPKLQIPSISVV